MAWKTWSTADWIAVFTLLVPPDCSALDTAVSIAEMSWSWKLLPSTLEAADEAVEVESAVEAVVLALPPAAGVLPVCGVTWANSKIAL